jgi:hypothetical protein
VVIDAEKKRKRIRGKLLLDEKKEVYLREFDRDDIVRDVR